ncbi:MAG TPA: glycosyltransferase family 39 protein [Bryobacteraceae bacterium]|nr:glycosyltransferase family 39 protein [Bryobacteraceae bacterium]
MGVLSLLSAGAVWFFYSHGWLLYYGDSEAHLNIARRILDSQTPGYDQLGTYWLPLTHVLMLPFVRVDAWWHSGIAASFSAALCFVVGGTFLFAAARRIFQSTAAGAAAAGMAALNPNLLYLQSTAMTEAVFFAALMGVLYFSVRFWEAQGWGSVLGAGIATCAATLTRYEGWLLIPFVAGWFLWAGRGRRFRMALLFCVVASAGPVYWMAHGWWETGDWLDWYNSPYSARAIQGNAPCPGRGDWHVAWYYYRNAVQLCAGTGLAVMGVLGIAWAAFSRLTDDKKRSSVPLGWGMRLWRARGEEKAKSVETNLVLARRDAADMTVCATSVSAPGGGPVADTVLWAFILLSIPGAFIIWSMHSGVVPIFMPHLWPHSYYNTRYGLAALPLLALAAASLVTALPERMRPGGAVLLIGVAIIPWLAHPSAENWITWAESRANSNGRRAWMHEAAEYLAPRYVRGSGIITSQGDDFAGIYREMGIPLRETFSISNGLVWNATVERPDKFLWQEWAVVKGGDPVQTAINRAARYGIRYQLELTIIKEYEPVVEIYRRIGVSHGRS